MPSWFKVSYIWKLFCPEVLEWGFRLFYLSRPGESATEAPAKKIVDLTGAENVLYPSTLQAPEDQDNTTEDHDKTAEDEYETD